MVRYVFVACLAIALAACSPALKIKEDDPWSSLQPWKHTWKEIQTVEVTGAGTVNEVIEGKVILAESPELDGSWLIEGTLVWTSGANTGVTSKVSNHENGFVELAAAPPQAIAPGDAFTGKAAQSVEYVVIRKGDGVGDFPAEIDEVEVHYDGRLASNGDQFDSSYERGETSSFRLNQVIKGWTKGLQRMRPGDEVMFWIPWSLAYGERGRPGAIPPRADLMFQVELIGVTKAAASDPEAWAKVTPWPTDSSEVIRTTSGLEYLVVESGPAGGPTPTDRDFVYVHYEGRIDEGDVVESTFAQQRPGRFPVADLVPGWSEAMRLMRKGDHWMLRVPAHLMYGDEGDGRIPPGAALTYEVLLEEVIVIAPPDDPQ